ncbi:TonB-dependent receptor [Parabacteroides chongii]|uniref:TonB-dependent receptor n=1 Tax=Parabacteroides chongii TaxID=2685834 RepID=UPI00240E3662|nr:TonB-dependent receptor [Parabacteroides chongii]WFE86755.1 TonB-dependent receptor [Parabacteroides chongii]
MRITTFLLLVCVFCSFAENTHSQNARVSISKSNARLDNVLSEIESQTDYLFIYNNQVDVNRKVSVKVKNKPVSSVLDNLFKNTGIGYAMEGTHIVLTKNAENANPTQQQTRHITGTVVDVNDEPVIGANVVVKGTTNGTITDLDGRFTIEADSKSVLNVSYIGYLTKEITVGNQQSIRIILLEDTKTLDEVVVIGYGTQKKADLTGSVANVNTDDLNTQSNTTIGQALQGKIAGVDIVSQGGTPGGSTRIMVRGIGTLNNSAPLYIVDGMYMTGIDHINPNDIASIDVLKDASSAAIYGSRAANGVIIVTTKEGSNTEGKPIIDLSANIGVSAPSKYLNLLNAAGWAEVTTVSRRAAGLEPLDMALDLSSKPDNDWQDIMFGPALMQNYALSVKGGGKYSTYYNSVGYTNQDGVMKGTNYQRYTLQSKQDFKKGIFTAGTNVVLTYDQSDPLYGAIRGGMVGHTLQSIPTLEKYDSSNEGGYGSLYGDVVNLQHPMGMVDDALENRYSDNVKIYANAYVSVEPIKGLKYKLNVAPDFQFYRYNDYEGLYSYGLAKNEVTQVTEQQTRTRNVLVENLLSYDQTFGEHKVSLLAGYTYQDSRYRFLQGSGQGMPVGIMEIDAAAGGLAVSGNSTRSVLTSILGRAFYSYKNRYLITATIRRDGSSKFGSNHRYGNFPSVSAGWNIAEEGFVKNNASWLDQLKLRAGYGVLGNQEISNYQFVSVVSTGINYPNGNGGLIQGAFPKTFANPDIKWEETAMTNVGIDFMALRNRLTLTADWYVKNTKDILLNVPIPISTGGSNDPIRNAGKIRNQGVEFNIGWNETLNKDFSYGVNFLGTYNKNEVVEMGAESQAITGGTIHGGTYTSKTLAGYPIGGFWLIPTDGYFNSEAEVNAHQKDGNLIQPSAEPGDIRFKDTNNDGTINDDDRVYCGSPFPKFTYSINGNITYKNWDFSIGFQGVTGNKIYNATNLELTDVTRGTNYLASTLDYWTPNNQNAASPRLIWTDPNRNARSESDRYLESGSYFRLRNLQVGYTLPLAWCRGLVQKARVYVNAENLFTITSYSGYTPDVNSSDVYSRGFDEFIYPSNRTFMVGLNVTF